MLSFISNIKTKQHIRQILVTFLIVVVFFQSALAIVGNHGHFSVKNKEIAAVVYTSLAFLITIAINLLALSKNNNNTITLLSFILNMASGLILVYYLFYMTKFNLGGGTFPLLFFLLIGIQILMIANIISYNMKYLFKHWI